MGNIQGTIFLCHSPSLLFSWIHILSHIFTQHSCFTSLMLPIWIIQGRDPGADVKCRNRISWIYFFRGTYLLASTYWLDHQLLKAMPCRSSHCFLSSAELLLHWKLNIALEIELFQPLFAKITVGNLYGIRPIQRAKSFNRLQDTKKQTSAWNHSWDILWKRFHFQCNLERCWNGWKCLSHKFCHSNIKHTTIKRSSGLRLVFDPIKNMPGFTVIKWLLHYLWLYQRDSCVNSFP